jgi:hypothetical protein
VAWRGNPRQAATGVFYRAAAAWGDGGVSFARWIGGRGGSANACSSEGGLAAGSGAGGARRWRSYRMGHWRKEGR